MAVQKIKFGTDGWRAIIAEDYTVANVARVSEALAQWLLAKHDQPQVIVGHDCRFGGAMFAEVTAKVLASKGIKVQLAEGFVSTPMISYGVLALKSHQGVVITASHNPPSYNGYKLKGAHGGPSSPKDIAEVEALIPDTATIPAESLEHFISKGHVVKVDLEKMYIDYLRSKFDFEKLDQPKNKFAFDAMYGAGQNVIKQLFKNVVLLHCEQNPGFNGQAPEPLDKNLLELKDLVKNTPEIKFGLAVDGDADRIGLFDEHGKFVDAHHIILLLVHYLSQYKKMTGKVAIAFSTTDRVKKMAEAYGLPVEVTPIGFKHISEIMTHDDVLVGGEESGGIAVKGHIPERDGIYDGLVLMEFMVETGKSLQELCNEVYEVVGQFHYDRLDMHVENELKEKIINKASNNEYAQFGDITFHSRETIDGIKYHLDNGGWTMLRASGTEPLLRLYAEGSTPEETQNIIDSVKNAILS